MIETNGGNTIFFITSWKSLYVETKGLVYKTLRLFHPESQKCLVCAHMYASSYFIMRV